jgi:hypothetical protein
MVIMKDESGIDDVREGGMGVLADFHRLFDAPAFQGLLDSCHEFWSFGSGAFSVIEEPFQKDGDGQERAEEQDVHRKTTDLNDLQNCFPSKHLTSPSDTLYFFDHEKAASSNNITHLLGFRKQGGQFHIQRAKLASRICGSLPEWRYLFCRQLLCI